MPPVDRYLELRKKNERNILLSILIQYKFIRFVETQISFIFFEANEPPEIEMETSRIRYLSVDDSRIGCG